MPSYGRRKTDKVEIKLRSSIRSSRVLFYRILFVIGAAGSSLAEINRCISFTIETKAKVRYPLPIRGALKSSAVCGPERSGNIKTAGNIGAASSVIALMFNR